jgi:hypothetical protein
LSPGVSGQPEPHRETLWQEKQNKKEANTQNSTIKILGISIP